MKKYIVMYNPLSQKGHGLENAEKLENLLEDAEIRYEDMTQVKSASAFLKSIPADTELVFTGGDGTLNRVINALDGIDPGREIYYYPAGSGNDFVNDLHLSKDCGLIPMSGYMTGLPTVTANGETCKFINGVGLGLDGYCCEENERLKRIGKTKSYTMIAFEGVMGKYKPCGASVTVDGETRTYKRVWMVPVMFGSYYGGGVKMGPDQKRNNPDKTVTSVAIHDVGRVHALLLFLSVCKGNGGKYPRYIDYRVGHEITVEFETQKALQIDGEPVLNVRKYTVCQLP